MIHGVLVTHGRVGEALVGAIEHFLGPQDDLVTISNDSLSVQEIGERVGAVLDRLGDDDHLMLFTDLSGGSCDAACQALTRRDPRCVLVSGLNLPMLLDFCHYRHRLTLDELIERVLRKGRTGIQLTRTGGDEGAVDTRPGG